MTRKGNPIALLVAERGPTARTALREISLFRLVRDEGRSGKNTVHQTLFPRPRWRAVKQDYHGRPRCLSTDQEI
jgi:antitoxin (DNA-binding transcriptional repressor) of toxin-antitoxin stability system